MIKIHRTVILGLFVTLYGSFVQRKEYLVYIEILKNEVVRRYLTQEGGSKIARSVIIYTAQQS
jgi:hypothetical protein